MDSTFFVFALCSICFVVFALCTSLSREDAELALKASGVWVILTGSFYVPGAFNLGLLSQMMIALWVCISIITLCVLGKAIFGSQ